LKIAPVASGMSGNSDYPDKFDAGQSRQVCATRAGRLAKDAPEKNIPAQPSRTTKSANDLIKILNFHAASSSR
jgi:hypothetical protein